MLRTSIQACLLFLLSLVFSYSLYGATPQISGVAGEVKSGSLLTITGENLVDEDKTNWLPMFKSGTAYGFEGSNYISDGYAAAPDSGRHEPVYDTNVKIAGSKSYQGHIHGAYAGGGGSNNASSGAYIESGYTRADLYVRLYSRWKSVGEVSKWPDSHIKMLDTQGSGGDQMYLQPECGTNLPTEMNMIYNSRPHLYTVKNFLTNNRWYCMEARFKSSSPYDFTAWVDGVQLASTTPSGTCTSDYILFNMINLGGTGPDFDLYNWTDNFAVSTSRVYCSSIVEVGNSSDYATAKKVYQEPIYLSDGSVQVKLDLTGLGSGPYYLWVTNNRQQRSSSFGLGASGDSPAPPTGLRIVP